MASPVNMYNVSWCWVAGVCIVVILRYGWLVLVVPHCKYMASSFPVWCTFICVEFDLHKVVITLCHTSLKFKVSYTIGFLVKKHFYLYAVELVSSNQLKVNISI